MQAKDSGEVVRRTSAEAPFMVDRLLWRNTLGHAVAAGVISGCLMVGCIAALNGPVLHTPDFSLTHFFAFTASALVGKEAYTRGAYVAVGVGLHFLVSIGWALGYATLASRRIELRIRPLISGAMFGLVVYFAMQLVLVAANLYRTPTARELGIALLAHLVFYGVPVALLCARTPSPA